MRPWEWELLTVEDADHLLDWLDAYEKAQKETEAKLKKGR